MSKPSLAMVCLGFSFEITYCAPVVAIIFNADVVVVCLPAFAQRAGGPRRALRRRQPRLTLDLDGEAGLLDRLREWPQRMAVPGPFMTEKCQIPIM